MAEGWVIFQTNESKVDVWGWGIGEKTDLRIAYGSSTLALSIL